MAKRDKLGRYNPGRTPKPIDEKQVFELAAIGCTYSEIAAVIGVSKETLSRRFQTLITHGREIGKKSLRRAMYNKALKGNVNLMIFLSKQKEYLNFAEKSEETKTTTINVNAPVTRKQFDEAIKKDPFFNAKEVPNTQEENNNEREQQRAITDGSESARDIDPFTAKGQRDAEKQTKRAGTKSDGDSKRKK